MSVYNCEKTVKKAIDSIINQDYENFDLLVIDDASTDNTLKICKEFKIYPNFYLFKNNKNIGLTKSLNKLIEFSEGEYIARQDADDVSIPGRLSYQIKFMKENNYDVSFTRAINIQTNKLIPKLKNYLPYKAVAKYRNPFIHGTMMIKRNLMIKSGKYDENYYYSQDYKLIIDLIKARVKIGKINKPFYLLNTKNNISEKFSKDQEFFAQKARSK